ncbi:MAG: hypothetical protein EAZ55_13725 [Cytophagales bacterium]|nr:MAG: hypothetical protein EAZ55_13725 [Cytophagales bacterium]
MTFAVILGLNACGNGKKEQTKEDTTQQSEVKENLKKILNEVPKPTEIPYLLESTGVEFDKSLANKPAHVSKYKTTNFTAAVNLGVYATDIGYVSVYGETQNALEYMKSVKELGDKLGLTNVFDPSTVEKFKKNLSNKDSLAGIIDESIKSADNYLKKNERNNISSFVFAGSFIEGLYISTELVATFPKDLLPEDAKNQLLIPLVRVILKQKEPLKDLIKVLQSLGEEDEQVKKLISDLEALAKLYDDLNIEEKIKNNKGDFVLTDKTIQSITDKVRTIRNGIIG